MNSGPRVFYIRSPCATPIETWPYPPDTDTDTDERYELPDTGVSCRYIHATVGRSVWSFIRARDLQRVLHSFQSEIFKSFCLRFVYVQKLIAGIGIDAAPHSTSLSLSTLALTLTHAQRRVNNADPLDELQLTRSPSQRCSFSCSRTWYTERNDKGALIITVIHNCYT